MILPAPARLSITICCPSRLEPQSNRHRRARRRWTRAEAARPSPSVRTLADPLEAGAAAHRLRDEIALGRVAAGLRQQVPVRLGLDAFGNFAQLQLACELEARLQD